MLSTLRTLRKTSEGATAIEYALIATLISLAALVAFQLLGTNLETIYNNVASQI